MATQQPTALFQGYDSFLGQIRTAAVSGSQSTANAQGTSSVMICTDSDSVMQALNVSASLSGGFAGATLSASASVSESLNFTSTSVAVVVNTVYVTGDHQATSPSLLSTPAPATQDFFNAYGDSYVNEIILGGQYCAVFVFDSQTTDQQQQIKADLQGSSGVLSGSLSATLNSVSSSTNTDLRVVQQIYGVSQPTFPDANPDDIVAYALAFATKIDAATVLGFGIDGYEHVLNTPDFTAVVANRNLLGTASATPYVDATNALNALAQQMKAIQQMYTSYGYSGDTVFAANYAQLKSDTTALSDLIGSIETNVTGTYTAPGLPSLGYGTPQASFALTDPATTSPYAPLSTPFFDLKTPQILAGVKPASITLGGAIQITYSDGTSVTHGNLSSSPIGPMTIQPTDSISSVVVTTNTVNVMWLQVNTASGQSVGTIPTPVPSGITSTTYSAPPAIIGFLGSTLTSDGMLVTLSPIAITLSPAIWVNPPVATQQVKRTARAQRPAQARA